MANVVDIQILEDGPRNSIFKVSIFMDTSLVSQTIVDITTMSPVPTSVRIDHIDYAVTDGIEAELFWHATANKFIMPLAGRGRVNYQDYGGIQNNAGAGKNGNIDLTCVGATPSAATPQTVMLTLWMVKNGVQ